MVKDPSALRYLTERFIASLQVSECRVLEFGGRKGGMHESMIRGRKCEYVSVGYEGEVFLDLRTGAAPFEDRSFDVVLVSMTLMYLDECGGTTNVLNEASRVLKPGGRIFIFEPFLFGETEHKSIPDLNRYSTRGMERLLKQRGFTAIGCQKIGGIFSLGFTLLRDLLPGFFAPLRACCTWLGLYGDRLTGRWAYFRRRSDRYYLGYFAFATKA